MLEKFKSFFKKKNIKSNSLSIKNIESFLFEKDFENTLIQKILDELKLNPQENKEIEITELKPILKKLIPEYNFKLNFENKVKKDKLYIFLIFGINGSGKTTSIGKLSYYFNHYSPFPKMLLVACDQFRAAASEQLEYWAKVVSQTFFSHPTSKNPGAILHDAISFAKAKEINLMFVDTAGRLHNKTNLMNELKKLDRIIEKQAPESHIEHILILDSNIGKNALQQVKEFHEALKIHGIILTKTDSKAKSAILFSIFHRFQIPIYFLSYGENIESLKTFNTDDYIDNLLNNYTVK